jgi:hypothetical protein
MKNKGEILASILKEYADCYFFLHNTREFSVAVKIMNEGFIFENQLSHSTDRVNPNEPIEITYFLFQRKEYGNYTVVIAIPKDVYDKYTNVSDSYNTGIEEVMTITNPWSGDNDELMYVISPSHVLGYFSIRTAEFVTNPKWDAAYDNSRFRIPAHKPVRPDN